MRFLDKLRPGLDAMSLWFPFVEDGLDPPLEEEDEQLDHVEAGITCPYGAELVSPEDWFRLLKFAYLVGRADVAAWILTETPDGDELWIGAPLKPGPILTEALKERLTREIDGNMELTDDACLVVALSKLERHRLEHPLEVLVTTKETLP